MPKKPQPQAPLPGPRQPDIISISKDALGRTVVVDTEGTTVLDPSPGAQASGTFACNDSWGGGFAEIRWSSEDDQNNNRSLVHVNLYGAKSDNYTTYGSASFLMRANGDGWSGWYVTVNRDWVHLAGRDVWTSHGADGGLGMEVGVLQGEIIGTSCDNIWGTQWVNMTNYTVLPNPPFNIAVRAGTVATTSFGVDFWRSSHDHVSQDEVQWALDPGFTQVVWTDNPGGGGNGSQGYSNPSGAGIQLAPGTLHYVRARSYTARGWGGYSATVSQVTLPAVPPGLKVTPFPSGTSATVDLTPPGGVTGVTRYNVEYRVPGGATVETGVDGGNSLTVTALTPGQLYEWRASAVIGSYTSPWTDSTGNPPGTWLAVLQPNPNTSPGDYFDGDTTDTPGIDYVWTGTPGSSISQAVGLAVDGWSVSTSSPMSAVLHQAAGGWVGDSSARVLVQRDETNPAQMSAGMSPTATVKAEVAEGALYFGSVYVNPSRPQRLVAQLRWYNSAGQQVTITPGVQSVAPANVWTRMTASGVAPAGATYVVVRVIDQAGDGHALWLSGDSMLLDAAMVSLQSLFPYFDGDTPPTADYVYDWVGTPDASESIRTPVEDSGGFDPLDDPDCPPLPQPPRPPVVPADCIDEVGVWRRYWVQISGDIISDWLAVIPTIYITTKAAAARQVRVRIYENPDNLSPDAFASDEWHSEQIVSYIPPNTLITLDGVSHRTWAEVDGTEARPADKLLYGTGGTPATWPVLTCGMPYLMAFDTPLNDADGNPIPPGNLTVALALTERMG